MYDYASEDSILCNVHNNLQYNIDFVKSAFYKTHCLFTPMLKKSP